ncbi:MAG: hypothetical protein M0Z41_02305 [Peptococcaceae bacterium]|jgi:hypothetical protein|nr:hypothetical protein [Peptococcaceae bacterium]
MSDYSYFDQYDVVMGEMTPNIFHLIKELKRQSRTYVVGLVEGALITPWSYDVPCQWFDLINTIDMIGVLNEKAIRGISAFTNKPVRYLGIPFPVRWCKSNLQAKNDLIEFGNMWIGAGGMWNIAAFKRINADSICYPLSADGDRNLKKIINSSRMRYGKLTGWNDYFIEHSGYRMMIHLDQRSTWGRASLDCAAANMPCISTPYTQTQQVLYPRLCVDYWEVDKAVKLYRMLAGKSKFFGEVVGYAGEMLGQFDLDASKQRLLNALAK